jgi:hypothetical protein
MSNTEATDSGKVASPGATMAAEGVSRSRHTKIYSCRDKPDDLLMIGRASRHDCEVNLCLEHMTNEDQSCGTSPMRNTRSPGSVEQEGPSALRMRTAQDCLYLASWIRIIRVSVSLPMVIAHTVDMSTLRTAGTGFPSSGGRFRRSCVTRGLLTDASANGV